MIDGSKSTGIVLVFGGLMTVAFGFTLLLGSQEDRRSLLAVIGSLPARVFGIAVLAVGGGLNLLVLLEIVFPAWFDSLVASFKTSRPSYPD